jgi:DUF1365 family protein
VSGSGAVTARPLRSALCEGFVSHRRLESPAHGFRYRVYMTLLDLDELPELDRRLRLFGHERARPVSFRAADHLEGTSAGLREQLAARVRAGGATLPVGRVELLTHCRTLGHVFNPVSFFYCYDEADRLSLVVAEVNNTYGDRHGYVLPVADGSAGAGSPFAWQRKKLMHVSPFRQPDAGTYLFEAPPPAERVEVSIDLARGGQTAIATRLSLERRPLTDGALLAALVRYPLVTLKVVSAIHFEALRLWWKGAEFFPRPPYDPAAARGGPA